MMHNSLAIQDILRRANGADAARMQRQPHRHVAAHPTARPKAKEFALQGHWRIAPHSAGLGELAHDLADFLGRLGVAVDVGDVGPLDGAATLHSGAEATNPGAASLDGGRIDLAIDTTLGRAGYRIEALPGQIRLAGSDVASLWAAHAEVERLMRERKGPILPSDTIERRARWPVQISQAPWHCNYLVPDLGPEYTSDDAFRLLAHFGVNGMTIYGDWLCYVTSDIFPELNFAEAEANIAILRDATERAARYGISLYYVPVSPKLHEDHPLFRRHPGARGARLSWNPEKPLHNLCSSDEQVIAFHQETFTKLFEAVPKLGGLILLTGGESFYHCFMRPDLRHVPDGVGTKK